MGAITRDFDPQDMAWLVQTCWQQEILIIAIHIFFIGHKMGLSPVSVKAQTQRHGFPTSASQVAGQVNLCLQQSSMGFLRYAFNAGSAKYIPFC